MEKIMKDLTTGSLGKKILMFSIPLMLSNILQVLFNISDIAVVGKFGSSKALGAVGSTTTLVTLYTGILIGISGGINVLVARAIGAKEKKNLEETIHTAALLSLLIGFLLLVFGLISTRVILVFFRTKPELLENATAYMYIYLMGMPALAIYNFGNAVFSASGDTKRPLLYLTIAGVINVVFNLFFVIVLKIHVYGVALASVIAQLVSAILILRSLMNTKEDIRIEFCKLKMVREKVKELLYLGVPGGFQNAIFCIANLFVQSGVNSFSAKVVAGDAAASKADYLIIDIMFAFYIACGSFMGQNLGARNKERVKKSYLWSLFYCVGIALILGGLLILFGRQFLSLFTNEADVVEAGMARIYIMGFSLCVSGFMDCTIAASRALGKTVIPTVIVISGSCVFRIVWIYTIFAYFGTRTSLYLLYAFSWALTGIAEIIYFIKVYRDTFKEKVLIE